MCWLAVSVFGKIHSLTPEHERRGAFVIASTGPSRNEPPRPEGRRLLRLG